MTNITANMVHELRKRTGAGLMDCKQALSEAGADEEKAIDILKQKGITKAAKKAGRDASEGIVESYIHTGGGVGVLLELNCESDFVAKNEDFKMLARDLCMHIAAVTPTPMAVSREDIDEATLQKERDLAKAQAEGKPAAAIEKIIQGKLDKFLSQVALLEQSFVKNPDISIQDYITQIVQKTGENIQVRRFVRYAIKD